MLHERLPAAVARAAERAALLEEMLGLDPLARLVRGLRRLAADGEYDRLITQQPARPRHEGLVERAVKGGARAHRAAPAGLGGRVIQLLLKRQHQTAAVRPEPRHRALLGAPQLGDLLVALAVVGPRPPGREPPRAVAGDRTLDVEDLEQGLEPDPSRG